MIDIICTQRIKPGMEAQAEKVLPEAEKQTLAHDKGCERYEWYRGEEPNTYILGSSGNRVGEFEGSKGQGCL